MRRFIELVELSSYVHMNLTAKFLKLMTAALEVPVDSDNTGLSLDALTRCVCVCAGVWDDIYVG